MFRETLLVQRKGLKLAKEAKIWGPSIACEKSYREIISKTYFIILFVFINCLSCAVSVVQSSLKQQVKFIIIPFTIININNF